MTNRSTRVRGGPKKPLQIIELSFEGTSQEHLIKPHIIKRGGRRYPLSLYSFNKDPEYEQTVHEQVGRMIEDEYLVSRSSPSWALESSKEVTHSGEFPLFIHRLLSPSKSNGYNHHIPMERSLLRERRKSAPPKRPRTMYYRANRTHQYLSATDLRDKSVAEFNMLYGRPTRTTLLRARQRCNSAPMDSFESRKEIVQRAESLRPNSCYMGSKENIIHFYTESGESMHSFLVGSRYNRAHLLDSKSLSSYGVYMPRSNPKGCFMTGRTNARSDETPGAPPESPRSDIDEESAPVTTPRKHGSTRPTSGRSTPKSRPRSAWGDNTTTCNIYQNGTEDKENLDITNTDQITEELTILPDGVKGTRMLPPKDSKSGQKLPSVHGFAVSRTKKSHEEVDELLYANLPPPPAPSSTRENTDELQVIGTNSPMTQEAQQIDTLNKTNNAHVSTEDRNENVINEENVESEEIEHKTQDKNTETETRNVDTNSNVNSNVKDDEISSPGEIVDQAQETFGKSVRLKASQVLTKDKDSRDVTTPTTDATKDISRESTSGIVSENPDQPSEGDQDIIPTPVTDVKCDIKIFITEDGEESKPYEHTSG